MQSPRILVFLFLLLVAAGITIWQLTGDTSSPTVPLTSPGAAGEVAEPAKGAADEAAAPALVNTADGGVAAERTVADVGGDKDKPAVVGQVLDADGKPLAEVRVIAAPGLAFANANGQMDFDTFDFSDLEDAGGLDMSAMMRVTEEQLAARVETKTDAQGRFRIVPRGTTPGVGVRVLARGFAVLDRRVARPKDADVDVGAMSLQKAGIVSGRVVDGTGKPVADARVRRVLEMETRMMGGMMGGLDIEIPGVSQVEDSREGETARTDAQGRFELAHVAPGDFELRTRHPEHPSVRQGNLHLDAGQQLRDVLVTLPVGLEIRGKVSGLPEGAKGLQVMAAKRPRTDGEATGMMGMFGGGGADMADMFGEMGMAFGDRTSQLGEDGSFVLRGLARETYRVWVAQTGTGFAGNAMCSARIEVQAGREGVELRYEAGITVTLLVVDEAGAPVEKLWVRDRLRGGGGFGDMAGMMPSTARMRDYPGGRVEVRNLRPKSKQKLSLTVEAVGYRAFERSDIELPKTGSLDLGTVKLEANPVVNVVVLADATGRPVAGATVRLGEAGGRGGNPFGQLMRMAGGASGPTSARTDRDGRCTVNVRPGNAVVIEVENKQFAPFVSESLELAGKANEFTARLHVGGSVEVTVLDPQDQPVKDAVVEQKTPSGDQSQKKTDATGRVRFERLAPGAHSFRLGKDGGPMAAMFAQARRGQGEAADEVPWQAVTVADGAQATVKLQQQPSASLRGIVRENGMPLAGARVTFAKGSDDSPEDTAGRMVGDMMGQMGGGRSGDRGTTSEVGEYKLASLPEGMHRLRITHKQRAMPTEVAVTLRFGENVFDVDLESTAIRGKVLGPDGNPIEGARITAKVAREDATASEIEDAVGNFMPGMSLGGGNAVKTDATGAFELKGLTAKGALLVEATAKGLVRAEVRVEADKLGVPLQLKLSAAGKIKVSVANAPPFAAVTARWLGEGKEGRKMQLLRNGKVTLDGLRPGSWEIQVATRQDGAESQTRTVEVIANETIAVDM